MAEHWGSLEEKNAAEDSNQYIMVGIDGWSLVAGVRCKKVDKCLSSYPL